jgi:hypothetical protein
MGSSIENRAALSLAAAFGGLGAGSRQAIGAANQRITLTPGKTYRIIADTACNIKQSHDVAAVAVATEGYLPADQEMFLTMVPVEPATHTAPMPAAKYLNVIGSGGFLYWNEMLPGMNVLPAG